MKRRYLLALTLFSGDACAEEMRLFPPTFGEVRPAPAVQDFCIRHPTECEVVGENSLPELTAKNRAELDTVNTTVNQGFIYMTDQDLYNVEEYWTINTLFGDCEDVALLKRHILLGRGWPSSSLRITVVQKPDGLMHAVLAVHTEQGTLILDKVDEAPDRTWFWYEIPYIYVVQQSSADPRKWVALSPPSVTATDWRLQHWTTSD